MLNTALQNMQTSSKTTCALAAKATKAMARKNTPYQATELRNKQQLTRLDGDFTMITVGARVRRMQAGSVTIMVQWKRQLGIVNTITSTREYDRTSANDSEKNNLHSCNETADM